MGWIKSGIQIKNAVFQAVAILVLSSVVGLLYNYVSKRGIPLVAGPRPLYYTGDSTDVDIPLLPTVTISATNKNPNPEAMDSSEAYSGSDTPSTNSLPWQKPLVITLEQAYQIFKTGKVIFFDVRGKKEYLNGHIKGALNLSFEGLDPEHPPRMLAQIPKNTLIITYCDGTGGKTSIDLAYYLNQLGYYKVRIFYAGWVKWLLARYPVEK